MYLKASTIDTLTTALAANHISQSITALKVHITGQKENNIMAMTVEIKGNKLCIEIDLETPTPSSSGKTLVVASSRGNAVTTAMVDGKPVTIGLNAYIKP